MLYIFFKEMSALEQTRLQLEACQQRLFVKNQMKLAAQKKMDQKETEIRMKETEKKEKKIAELQKQLEEIEETTEKRKI